MSPARVPVTVVPGDEVPEPDWRLVHASVLAPGFPPEEQIELDDFLAHRGHPRAQTWFARVGDEPWCGVAVLNEGAGGTTLLAYLAASSAARGRGVGSALLDHVRERHPLLLIEIEDPARHDDRGFGDPRRRVAFYHAHGVREVVVPFYQPAVAPGMPRVSGMLLGLSRPVADTPDETEERIPAGPVRAFVTDYVTRSDGGFVGDEGLALEEALRADELLVRPLLPRP